MPFQTHGPHADPGVLGRTGELFRTAVRHMRTHLINRVGHELPVRFADVGTATWDELSEQFLEEGEAIYVRFRIAPGGHEGVLAIDGALLFRIMGLLLGEDPWGEPAPYVWRPPTRMDRVAARRIASDVFAGLVEALPHGVEGGLEVLEVTGNPRLDTSVAGPALMVDATLDFGPPEEPYGLMILALPFAWSSALWPDAPAPRDTSEAGVARVLPLPVTMVAELARVKVPLGDLQRLAVGEVIELGTPGAVRLSVGERPGFTAEPGAASGRRCVRIHHRLAAVGQDAG